MKSPKGSSSHDTACQIRRFLKSIASERALHCELTFVKPPAKYAISLRLFKDKLSYFTSGSWYSTALGSSDDNYHSIRNIDVFDIPVGELVFISHDFKRYIRILKENGIDTTVDPATAYITCSLSSCRSLGRKFFGLLKDFPDHHVTCRQMYDEIKEKLNRDDFFNEPA